MIAATAGLGRALAQSDPSRPALPRRAEDTPRGGGAGATAPAFPAPLGAPAMAPPAEAQGGTLNPDFGPDLVSDTGPIAGPTAGLPADATRGAVPGATLDPTLTGVLEPPQGAVAGAARIGPNAILQLLPVLDRAIGPEARAALLDTAGVTVPAPEGMIPEAPAAALHRAVRAACGRQAPGLLAQAGRATGQYILARRIPPLAQSLLKALPAPLAARALSGAISRHAWTFVGSGQFSARTPWLFEIAENPVISGERASGPICHWHAAVFETLYRTLVDPRCRCREVACRAQGAPVCRFEITR